MSEHSYSHKITGQKPVRLKDYDPDDAAGLSRGEAEQKTAILGAELAELDDLVYYAGMHAVLIVLQGRDTSGKDGATRHLLAYINALSCRVVPFKVPTEAERSHDFLWRIHQQTPGRGSLTIFNRSHYEDVLVVRVHNLVPESIWRNRYDRINHFESLLHEDADTIVLKFYLHISKEEQEERLLEREKEMEKGWKLAVNDWKEREYWDDYTKAYEDALTRCSTPEIPWYLVPADKKWFRDLAIVERLVEALRPYREPWLKRLAEIGETAKRELEAYRRSKNQPGR